MQQPKRFQAPTLAEAYHAVRQELGESAVILSTRKAFAPGLFGQPGRQFVEVVARVPRPAVDEPRRPALEQDMAAHDLVRAVAEADASGTADVLAPVPSEVGTHAAFQQIASADDRPETEVPVMSAAASRADSPWGRQLDQMRGMLEQIMADRHDARIEAGPAILRSMRDRLVRHGLSQSLAASIVGDADGADAPDEAAMHTAVVRRLAGKLPPAVALNAARRRTMFLVGPAGAGKTTLAMRLALEIERQQRLHVVVAGTDVTRAGAPQQFLAIGAATGLDVRLCYSPDELTAILDEPGVDLVIVDTAGHSGLRRDRMSELSTLLQVARQRAVILAVPATMKAADLQETVSAYSAVGIDGLAVTRCDETSHLGDIATVSLESSIGLAYTTHSEQVSDPAVPVDNGAFASAVVHAEWPEAVNEEIPAGGTPARAHRLAKVG